MEGTRLLLEETGIRNHDLPSPLNVWAMSTPIQRSTMNSLPNVPWTSGLLLQFNLMVLEITSKHFWLKIDDMEGESRLFGLPVCSEKRFIFFSIYPLTSFLTGLAKCVQALLYFDEKLQLKLQTCNLVLHIDRSAWHTFLDSHLTHVQLGMCRTPLRRSCTFWFTGAPNNKLCDHNNLPNWWKIWNGWVFGVSFVWAHKGWFHDGKLWE